MLNLAHISKWTECDPLTFFETYLAMKKSDLALNARKASFWLGGTRSAKAAQSMADFAILRAAI